jgi:hypothetical protein
MRETQIGQPHAAAQAGITEWHRIVAESDWTASRTCSLRTSSSATPP